MAKLIFKTHNDKVKHFAKGFCKEEGIEFRELFHCHREKRGNVKAVLNRLKSTFRYMDNVWLAESIGMSRSQLYVKLGLKEFYGNAHRAKYTDEEREYIIENMGNVPYAEMGRKLGRTRDAIMNQAQLIRRQIKQTA